MNRQKLIEAASEVMRTRGGDVPMEEIAERAGLTRGTLYRNFPHRQAIYSAVLEHHLEHLGRQIVEESDEPLAFIRRMTEIMAVYDKFLIALPSMEDFDFRANEDRMIETLAPALAAAQAQSALRASLTASDIMMACRMLASHLRLDDPHDRDNAISLRLNLLLEGLVGGPG